MLRLTLWLAVLLPVSAPVATAQQPESDQSPQQQKSVQQRPEAGVDDVVVVTASRREEAFINAPATMTVLTGEFLEQARGQSIPDLLRVVPGLNIVQTSARDFNITARAATGTLAHCDYRCSPGRTVACVRSLPGDCFMDDCGGLISAWGDET